MTRVFQHRPPPVPATPAGYSWLIGEFALRIPPPPRMAAIGESHARTDTSNWLILSPRYAPQATLAGQVTFAFKYEGVDLSVLAALSAVIPREQVEAAVLSSPSGKYMRRFWFLMEWLTGTRLEIPDASPKRGLVPVLDAEQQFSLDGGEVSERHRVINNLPGTPAFCPLIRRTGTMQAHLLRRLSAEADEAASRTPAHVLARASAFLLLSDSKASFQIEQERPSPDRSRRWAQAIGRAGALPLSTEALVSLQEMVIGNARFVKLGLREEGGFVGIRDRSTGSPIPEHVSARPEDLPSLIAGLVAFQDRVVKHGMDPIAAAASVSFGFVYIHPFEDGNGRLHRWLIHHVLAATGFTPVGFVFPVSRVLLRRIDDYRRVLESYSKPLLEFIEWETTPKGNVRVLNETVVFYQFFDATLHAEFLYHCVAETVDRDLPDEVAYLEAFDRFAARIQAFADMPDHAVDRLRGFLEQNNGALSERARTREFKTLARDEVTAIEEIYAETLGLLRP